MPRFLSILFLVFSAAVLPQSEAKSEEVDFPRLQDILQSGDFVGEGDTIYFLTRCAAVYTVFGNLGWDRPPPGVSFSNKEELKAVTKTFLSAAASGVSEEEGIDWQAAVTKVGEDYKDLYLTYARIIDGIDTTTSGVSAEILVPMDLSVCERLQTD